MIPNEFPRFMIAVDEKIITIRSPKDGQDGLAVFWSEAAASKVARRTTEAVVIEATQEMFVVAVKKSHEMGVPWLYIGTDLEVGVEFERVRLVMALGLFAFDGQHRHGEN